ncbi:MAG: EAL domain-containing protein [Ruminococcus sp.]|nr:EAL domain-containing protein [Ruminococcus sp.]MDE6848952.1 EAL domain-containing protein [Ruminococcus sp.]
MDTSRLKRLDSMFETFSIIAEGNYVYLCDMKCDYSRWSKSAVDYFNLPDRYMHNAGTIWEEHIHPDDRESYRNSINKIFSGQDKGHNMQYRAKSADGNYVVCTCRGAVIRDENGEPEYFAGAIKNHGSLSYIDTITGLRSLYGFFDDLKTLLWKKARTTAVIIGITGFSIINDVYGYKFGNKVLRKLSDFIQNIFGNAGAVYRMDGTKFAILTRNMEKDEISVLYNNLQEKVSHAFFIEEERISLSLNAGLMIIDDFDIASETVYSCLKYAYYESKNRRLGDMVIFENIQNDDNKKFIEKLNVIRNSVIENCEGFYLCYQPIMYADTEKLKGMEALVRWQNEKYGTVPPVQFVPVLEQDVLFPELGKWILRQAMTDGKIFLEKYPDFIMNVNISYAQLERSDFVSDVFSLLQKTGFPSENLCLEITERCRLLDIDILNNMFKIFRKHGIKIALDDFGTGFSSLGVLRTLPIDTVKIDREFVKDIEKSTSDQNTVKFISSLAGAFSAEVCVEGVETAQMRDFLRKYGIKSFQGYYYSKPIPMEELIKKEF